MRSSAHEASENGGGGVCGEHTESEWPLSEVYALRPMLQRRPWAVLNRFFALASMLHLSGSNLESMSEFYDNFFLRAVTLLQDG